ncbi:hypothetical protein DFO70_102507 [Cytobacillus firmus]|uniref:Uncharacterized protein n=2 Tax=Cytobacillus TaxID=2675230 RepID=A0A366K3C1_CYTFI|nr:MULTISPECIES: hypothetical protein [Cytobacillus]RBP96180.1 hypothetical protein DFO70_102507 [Cytobacillus firmus]TDX45093.1 hypothetical protein DFO72_103507 [Cytobacillus oceanisediminis]
MVYLPGLWDYFGLVKGASHSAVQCYFESAFLYGESIGSGGDFKELLIGNYFYLEKSKRILIEISYWFEDQRR